MKYHEFDDEWTVGMDGDSSPFILVVVFCLIFGLFLFKIKQEKEKIEPIKIENTQATTIII